MGQLEKYGLYVLCLLIFLMLGVAMWGEPPAPTPSGQDRMAKETKSARELETAELMSMVSRPEPKVEPRRSGPRVEDDKNESGNGAGNGENAANGGGGDDKNKQSPAPAPKAERPVRRIADGDTFEAIAKSLGDVGLVTVLQELNPKVRPERLKIGEPLLLPTEAEIAARKKSKDAPVGDSKDKGDKAADKTADKTVEPKADKDRVSKQDGKQAVSASYRTYTVENGDTLSGIAERQLGKTRRVDELLKLNPTIDPARLRIGQKIKLPAK